MRCNDHRVRCGRDFQTWMTFSEHIQIMHIALWSARDQLGPKLQHVTVLNHADLTSYFPDTRWQPLQHPVNYTVQYLSFWVPCKQYILTDCTVVTVRPKLNLVGWNSMPCLYLRLNSKSWTLQEEQTFLKWTVYLIWMWKETMWRLLLGRTLANGCAVHTCIQ